MHHLATSMPKLSFQPPFWCEKLKCFGQCRQKDAQADGQTDIVKPVCPRYIACLMEAHE